MEKILHPAATRVTAIYGWLHAKYSFRFVNYFDSIRTQIEVLRVLKGIVVAALTKIPTTRDVMRIWKTKSVSMTTENNIHVLFIEIPIQ